MFPINILRSVFMTYNNAEEPIEQTCPAAAYQLLGVCVPVTVTPFANTGATVTKCCGEPSIVEGRNTCDGTKNGTCVFTVTQDICVEVPVEFGAVASVGDTYVNCKGVLGEEICSNCDNK
jgi:hypothetical protein